MSIPTPQDPGEDMNVRVVHGAIWREFAEPIESWRKTPWYLRHFYAVMAIAALIYLVNQVFDWNEYEEDAVLRSQRNREQLERNSQPKEQAKP